MLPVSNDRQVGQRLPQTECYKVILCRCEGNAGEEETSHGEVAGGGRHGQDGVHQVIQHDMNNLSLAIYNICRY